MNRRGLFFGLAVIVLIGVLGYFWFNRVEPGIPIAAEVEPEASGSQVEPAKSPEAVAVPAPEPESDPSPVVSQAPKSVPEPQAAPDPQAAPAPKQDDQEVVARIAPQEPMPAVKAIEEPALTKPSVKTRKVAPPRDTGLVAILPSFDVVRVEPSGEAVVAGRATPGSTVRLIDGTRGLAEVETNENGEWVIVLRVPLAPGAHELSLESRLTSGEILLSENVVVVNVPAPALVAEKQPPPPAASTPETAAPTSQTDAATSETAGASGASISPIPARASGVGQATIESVRPLAVLMPRAGTGPSRIIQAPEPIPSNLGDKALLLETVDYDDRGRAVIGGRGAVGVVLLLYLDDRPAGRTVVAADGRWRAQLDGEISFGVHTLRIDEVNNSGKVVARVVSPFSRANVVAALGEETAVIVQPGNSLWRIARRIYGEGTRYSVIYTANQNQIGDPDLIYPGQIFLVPAN